MNQRGSYPEFVEFLPFVALSPYSSVKMPLKSRSRDRANSRITLLMLLLFLSGMAVGALWVYRSTHKPGTPSVDVGRTLADSTRGVLKNLNSPVEIQFYSLLTEGRRPLGDGQHLHLQR